MTSRFFPGGDESKEKTSGAELEIGSHVAFFFGGGIGAGAGGDVIMASCAFDVIGTGWGELAKGSDDSIGFTAGFGFGGERRTGCGELAKGSESSASIVTCGVGFVGAFIEGLILSGEISPGELVSSIGSSVETRPFPFLRTGGRSV